MNIERRLNALEQALGGDACPECGNPTRATTDHAIPHDRTIGGLCPKCRRLLTHDRRPFGDYWTLGLGDRLASVGGRIVWTGDGEPITGPDHAVKVLDRELIDGP